MTIPGAQAVAGGTTEAADAGRGRRLAVLSILCFLGYVFWFWFVFALGYWVTDLVGAYPSGDVPLRESGLGGVVGLVALAALTPMPNWIGALLGRRAQRAGGGRPAAVGLWGNLVVGIGLAVLILIGG